MEVVNNTKIPCEFIKKKNNIHFDLHDLVFIIKFQSVLHVSTLFPAVIRSYTNIGQKLKCNYKLISERRIVYYFLLLGKSCWFHWLCDLRSTATWLPGSAGSNHVEGMDAGPLVVLCVVCVCVCVCVYMYIYTHFILSMRIVIHKERGQLRRMQLNVMEMGSETVNWFVLFPDNNTWSQNLVNMTVRIVW